MPETSDPYSQPQPKPRDLAFLKGPRVYLRSLERDDLPLVRKWYSNRETRAKVAQVLPLSITAAEEWFASVEKDPNRVWFAVVEAATDRVIGEAGLLRIDHPWRTSDLTIIIGEPDARDRGYGTEAILLLIDWAFGSLSLHRLALGVVGFNDGATHFYEKVGFRREGVQRDGYYYDHQYYDFIMLSLLEDEFWAMYPEGIEATLEEAARRYATGAAGEGQ